MGLLQDCPAAPIQPTFYLFILNVWSYLKANSVIVLIIMQDIFNVSHNITSDTYSSAFLDNYPLWLKTVESKF